MRQQQLLIIAGSDPSGAGLQADLMVSHALGIHAVTVITAVTAQSHQTVIKTGVLSAQHIQAQLDSIDTQSLAAIKIGLLGNKQTVKVISEFIKSLDTKPMIILDPVITSSSNQRLLTKKGLIALKKHLLPLVDLVTPNWQEWEALASVLSPTIRSFTKNNTSSIKTMLTQPTLVESSMPAILLKGGHEVSTSDHALHYSYDYFYQATIAFSLRGKRWNKRSNVRGTGCMLSTAIACAIIQGHALTDAIVVAKALISRAIRESIPIKSTTAYRANLHNIPSYSGAIHLCDMPILHYHTTDNGVLPMTHQAPLLFSFPRCNTQQLGIYPVVDSFEWIKKLVPLGIKTIQLRIKNDTDNPPPLSFIESEIQLASKYCHQQGVRLFINDHWELAIKHNAYGIHLGQEDLSDANLQAIAQSHCHLGISTHCYAEIARTLSINPSYIALGPIYSTTSKIMPWIPQGVEAVKHWVDLLGKDYPLVAIGGINYQRAKALKATGIGSVAMITAITEAADYRKATTDLLAIF